MLKGKGTPIILIKEKLRTNQDGVTISGNTDINGNLDLTGSASTKVELVPIILMFQIFPLLEVL